MARTRGITQGDDVAVTRLDRQGNPISPAAALLTPVRKLNGAYVVKGPGAEVVPAPGAVIGWRSAPDTWARNMDAYELARLLDLVFKKPGDWSEGFILELTPEEYTALSGDLRRHFMAIRSS